MKIAGMSGWEVIMLNLNEKLSERDKIHNFSKNLEVTKIGAIHILRNTLPRVGEIKDIKTYYLSQGVSKYDTILCLRLSS